MANAIVHPFFPCVSIRQQHPVQQDRVGRLSLPVSASRYPEVFVRTFTKAFGTVFAAAAIATAIAPAAGAVTVAGNVPAAAAISQATTVSGTITPDHRRNPCKDPMFRRHHRRECR